MTLDNYKKVSVSSKEKSKVMKELESKRTRCEVYTRVMGYHRPVSSYNTWKKSEFYSRKYFEVTNSNTEFNNQYS